MAKIVIYTNGPNDGQGDRAKLNAQGIPFTEVRVDLPSTQDLPDLALGTRDMDINSLKAMIREIWLKVRSI